MKKFLSLALLCLALLSIVSCRTPEEYSQLDREVDELLSALRINDADRVYLCLGSDMSRADFNNRYPAIYKNYAPAKKYKLERIYEAKVKSLGETEARGVYCVSFEDRVYYISATVISGKQGLSSVAFYESMPEESVKS